MTKELTIKKGDSGGLIFTTTLKTEESINLLIKALAQQIHMFSKTIYDGDTEQLERNLLSVCFNSFGDELDRLICTD